MPPIEGKQIEKVIEVPQAMVEETQEMPSILNVVVQSQDGEGNEATIFFMPQADNKIDTLLRNFLNEKDMKPALDATTQDMLTQAAWEATPEEIDEVIYPVCNTLLALDEDEYSWVYSLRNKN
jgi:hypothetical protein